MKKTYKILLIDADMTLLDFQRSEKKALKKTFEHFGIVPAKEATALYHKINSGYWEMLEQGRVSKEELVYLRYKDLIEKMGLDIDHRQCEDYYQYSLGQEAYTMKDAKEVCHYLGERYSLYIVTNGISSTQYSRMKKSGLDVYFKDIFVSEDTGYQKPMVEYFNYVFDKIGEVDKDEVLIIGDSLSSDIQGGINAGVDTCWFNYKKEERKIDIEPDYVITELKELELFL